MLARLSLFILILITVSVTFTCPFVRRTRKGILFVHYVLLWSMHAWDSLDADLPIGASCISLLHALSIFTLLAEHAFTLNKKDTDFQSVVELLPSFAVILVIDTLGFLCYQNAFFIGGVLLFFAILSVCSYLSSHPRQKIAEIPIDDLDKVADSTFFFDLDNPFNCLGRCGLFHVVITLIRLVVGLTPYISTKDIRTVLTVVECIQTWLILVSPVIVGGFVQTAKLVGRHIIETQLHRRVLEAEEKDRERGKKKRRREELLASVEEIFGDEVGLTELI